jgi:predicted  nucleic acid-binding Zn-ribbon protein
MKAVLQALLDLQEVDRDLFRTQEELKRLPRERADRRAELDRRIAKINESRSEAKKLRVRIKELEDLATVSRQRVRKVEGEAAGARSDMALLAAYQHEIRNLKRGISDAEEEGLRLLEQAENIDKDAAALQARLDEDEKVFAEFAQNVENEMNAAEARRAKLAKMKSDRLKGATIPPDALATYTRLLAAREGLALSHLEGRICQSCYMEIPTNQVVRVARGSEIVQCPSCDRILYVQR